ncbi:hypothetical protein DOY81_010580 [Sarcophaga bullata]|nr:hypothetical protein DOY81_010580 [Sarcophaga bullata]
MYSPTKRNSYLHRDSHCSLGPFLQTQVHWVAQAQLSPHLVAEQWQSTATALTPNVETSVPALHNARVFARMDPRNNATVTALPLNVEIIVPALHNAHCHCSATKCGDNCACATQCTCVCKNGPKEQCCENKNKA